MANHPSQQPLMDWTQPEEEVVGDLGFPLNNYGFDVQGSIQPLTTFQDLSDTSMAQVQGMATSFSAWSQPGAFSDTGTYPPLYQNLSYLPENGSLTPAAMNYSLGDGLNGGASAMGIDHTALHMPYSEIHHDYSGQMVPLTSGSFKPHGPVASEQFRMEPTQWTDFSTLLTNDGNMQDVANIPSHFSHFQDSTQVRSVTESLFGSLPNGEWDPAQFSSAFSCDRFHGFSVESSDMDYNLENNGQSFNKPIGQDVGANCGVPSGPEIFLAGATSTMPMTKIGSSQNPIDITESSGDAMGSQLSSSIPDKRNRTRRRFGPSRPVSLPPKRRGGRKGPLPKAELEKRSEAKKQGVCIRCRALGLKCVGFPCMLCLKNPNAVLWRFPCTKAQILDLVECGSYFPDIEIFQSLKIKACDADFVTTCIRSVQAILDSGVLTHFPATEIGPFKQGSTNRMFRRGLKVLRDILDRASQSNSPLSRQMIETPYRLGHSKSSLPLVAKENLRNLETTDRLEQMIKFGSSESPSSLPTKPNNLCGKSSEGAEVQMIKTISGTISSIFYWIYRRYYEIKLFRRLQEAVNHLSSLTTKELSEVIITLLDLLTFGLNRISIFRDTMKYGGKILHSAYVDKRKRIRQALFIYLDLAFRKLPVWYNFWHSVRRSWYRDFPDISKHRFTDLESFDRYIRYELERPVIYMALRRTKSHDLGITKIPTIEESIDLSIVEDNVEIYMSTMNEIYHGPRNERVDLEAIYIRLTTFYQSKLTGIEKALKSMDGTVFPWLLQALENLECMSLCVADVRRSLGRELEIQPGSHKRKEGGSNVKDLGQSFLNFVGELNFMLHSFAII